MTERPHFLSLWAINDRLDALALADQLAAMKGHGLDGVVFHPRFYPNEPAYLGPCYMDALSKLIVCARELGMDFWIYDENGWPSGTAGGLVQAAEPRLTTEVVALRRASSPLEASDVVLRGFSLPSPFECASGVVEGGALELCVVARSGPSPLDELAVDTFIRVTHEAYRCGLAKEAFEYVTGFFSDEVHLPLSPDIEPLGAIPWLPDLPQRYLSRYGEELVDALPALFLDIGDFRRSRVRFWELVSDLLASTYYGRLEDWGRRNGKLMTAHLKGEESLAFQIPYSVSCFQMLRRVPLPAVDSLERYPGNDMYPRIASSIADQFGDGRCLVECFGGAGWGAKPGDLERYLLWLAGHGFTDFVLHLSQYSLKSEAVRDWPPSHPFHVSWRDAYRDVLASVRATIASPRPNARKAAPALVVAPVRGTIAAFRPWEYCVTNPHDGSHPPATRATEMSRSFLELIEACHAKGLSVALTDERTLELEGHVEADGALRLGAAHYSVLVIADGCVFEPSGEAIIGRFKEWGGTITKPEVLADTCEEADEPRRRADPAVEIVLASGWRISSQGDNVLALELRPSGKRRLSATVEIRDRIDFLLRPLDAVQCVSINGHQLRATEDAAATVFPVAAELVVPGRPNVIDIVCLEGGEPNPITFIVGDFAVLSESRFRPFSADQLITEGPFYLAAGRLPDLADIVSSGRPFAASPVALLGEAKTGALERGASVSIAGICADAARLGIDGLDFGWAWGPEWRFVCPTALAAGTHALLLAMVPSTFNLYGPHHYIGGDYKVISPAQYRGEKNFADPEGFPEITNDTAWRLRAFGIRTRVEG